MTILGAVADSLARRIALIAALISIVAVGVFAFSWSGARDARVRLQTTIDSANKTIAAAGDRENARDAQLKKALAEISAAKQRVKTPAEAAAAISAALPQLPEPIEITLPQQTTGAAQADQPARSSNRDTATRGANQSASGGLVHAAIITATSGGAAGETSGTIGSPVIAEIPQADLKPLYDGAEDCRACQLKLAAAQGDLSDVSSKLAATSSQRDAAIKAAKRGSTWTRIKRVAKWLAIGAAIGALSARATR